MLGVKGVPRPLTPGGTCVSERQMPEQCAEQGAGVWEFRGRFAAQSGVQERLLGAERLSMKEMGVGVSEEAILPRT